MASSTLAKTKSPLKAKHRTRAAMKRILEAAFRERFPQDTIDITDGFEGTVHVLVVSRVFTKMAQRARYYYLWKIVERTDLSESEKDSVTVVVGVSPQEVL